MNLKYSYHAVELYALGHIWQAIWINLSKEQITSQLRIVRFLMSIIEVCQRILQVRNNGRHNYFTRGDREGDISDMAEDRKDQEWEQRKNRRTRECTRKQLECSWTHLDYQIGAVWKNSSFLLLSCLRAASKLIKADGPQPFMHGCKYLPIHSWPKYSLTSSLSSERWDTGKKKAAFT